MTVFAAVASIFAAVTAIFALLFGARVCKIDLMHELARSFFLLAPTNKKIEITFSRFEIEFSGKFSGNCDQNVENVFLIWIWVEGFQ